MKYTLIDIQAFYIKYWYCKFIYQKNQISIFMGHTYLDKDTIKYLFEMKESI